MEIGNKESGSNDVAEQICTSYYIVYRIFSGTPLLTWWEVMHGSEGHPSRSAPKHVEPRYVWVALVIDQGALMEQTTASEPPLPLWTRSGHDAIAVQLLLAQ